MSLPEFAYALQGGQTGPDVLRELGRTARARFQPEASLRRSYLDTFDWRLFRAGFVLSEERGPGGGRILRLESREGRPSRSTPAGRVSFARDLPPGWLRERIEPVAAGRRLLPRVKLEGRLHTLDLLDEEEKTVARATLEQGQASLPDGGSAALPQVLRVHPLQGYDEEARRAAELLEGAACARLVQGTGLEVALRALGAWPGTDPSNPRVLLHGGTRADVAARSLLLSYLAVFEANEPGVRADLDPEFLHDLRVACRRTRSLLGELDGVIEPEIQKQARDGFAWLGAKTGPVRDLDVLLGRLCDQPAEQLKPLVLHATRRRREALRALRQALDSERRRKLFEAWHSYLNQEPEPQGGDGARPIEEVARERIGRRVERFLARGQALSGKAKANKVHRLRIQAKKLRYLVDAFGALFSPEAAAEVVKRLKKLQDALGEFNDRQVEMDLLERFADEMAEGGAVPATTLLAMGRRQAEVRRGVKGLRRRFRRRFKRFAEEAPLDALRGRSAEEPA